jgi:hypothetical protein
MRLFLAPSAAHREPVPAMRDSVLQRAEADSNQTAGVPAVRACLETTSGDADDVPTMQIAALAGARKD